MTTHDPVEVGLRLQRDALGESLRRLVAAVEGLGFNPAREPGLALAEARQLVRTWEIDTLEKSPRGDAQYASGDLPEQDPYRRLLDAVFGEGEFAPEMRRGLKNERPGLLQPVLAQLRADAITLVELANHEDDCATWGEDDTTGPIECDCRYGPIAERYPYNADGVIEPSFEAPRILRSVTIVPPEPEA